MEREATKYVADWSRTTRMRASDTAPREVMLDGGVAPLCFCRTLKHMNNEQHSETTDEARARISEARRAVAVADRIFGGRTTPVDMVSLAAMVDDGLREGTLYDDPEDYAILVPFDWDMEVTESGTIRAIPPGWKDKKVPRCRGFRILAVRETGDGMSVESCREEDAEFFGLYGVGQDGEDSHVGDFKTRQAAEEALLAVGGFFLGRSLGFLDLEEIMRWRIPSGGVK